MIKLFGTTVNETLSVFKDKGIHLDGEKQSKVTKEDRVKAIGRIIVTILLFGFSVYLISWEINKDVGNTIIGGIIGYWLK